MLKLFEVSGYKNFDQKLTIDFSDVRDYQFNTDCVSDGLLGKIIIYGKNGIGKSNLCEALSDINFFLQRRHSTEYDEIYLSSNNTTGYAEFRYKLQFGKDTVEYVYRKTAPLNLIYEKVLLDDELLFEFDINAPDRLRTPGLDVLAPSLNKTFSDLSRFDWLFQYVAANTSSPLLEQAYSYIMNIALENVNEGMILYEQYNSKRIIDRLEEFEEFLSAAGIHEKLAALEDPTGKKRLYFVTNPSKALLFNIAASSGTKTLLNLFYMYSFFKNSDRQGLLILDEFDAFYHYELSEFIVKTLKKLKHVQVIFTTHNTTLMSNDLIRPDCLFILTKDKLTSLANATNRELREGHNLEKLYMGGSFDA